jgi:hypothetical protein
MISLALLKAFAFSRILPPCNLLGFCVSLLNRLTLVKFKGVKQKIPIFLSGDRTSLKETTLKTNSTNFTKFPRLM